MEPTKKQLLDKTYQLFFDSMMDMNFPLEKVNSFVPEDVMGYGTTIDGGAIFTVILPEDQNEFQST